MRYRYYRSAVVAFCCYSSTFVVSKIRVPFSSSLSPFPTLEVLLKYVFVIILTVRLLATAATAVVAVS